MLASRFRVDQSAGESVVGRRQNNEDAFRVREDLGLYLVADGMGGHAGGEIASRLAADAIVRYFENGESTFPGGEDDVVMKVRMGNAIRSAVKDVENEAQGDLVEMGTTLAALLVDGDKALIAHVGDSRVYRLRGGTVERMTHDHSFENDLDPDVAVGMMEALPDQFGAMITRCIAADANTEPDLLVELTKPGDVFLLCSDGLTDVLDDQVIGEMLNAALESDASEVASQLIRAAYDAQSHDNITCVVVRIATDAASSAA